jgi:hypothetical protein
MSRENVEVVHRQFRALARYVYLFRVRLPEGADCWTAREIGRGYSSLNPEKSTGERLEARGCLSEGEAAKRRVLFRAG